MQHVRKKQHGGQIPARPVQGCFLRKGAAGVAWNVERVRALGLVMQVLPLWRRKRYLMFEEKVLLGAVKLCASRRTSIAGVVRRWFQWGRKCFSFQHRRY